ncbi:hypothetical protein K4K57_007527 [Colletotrichum sp. SAR 10_99]|nr:hypothetical protein K4K57_007527 [Colletotrichum sp. SAR 10_99]
MTNPPPGEQVHTCAKSAKDKVRKSGTSAERKIIQLGEKSQVFSTVVYFNPRMSGWRGPWHGPRLAQTYRQLSQNAQTSKATVRVESDMGAASAGVGAAAEETAHANTAVSQSHDDNVGINGAGRAGEAAIGHDGTPHAVRHGEMTAENWSQVDRGMAVDSALRNADRCVVKQEMPDGAVADGIRRAAPSASMLGFGAGGVSDRVEAGYKVEDERSGDVSEWETVGIRKTREFRRQE